jgi:CheY-like chemotaxis protein
VAVRDGNRRPRVLVVEDDNDIASLLSEILENEGYDAVAVRDPISSCSTCV